MAHVLPVTISSRYHVPPPPGLHGCPELVSRATCDDAGTGAEATTREARGRMEDMRPWSAVVQIDPMKVSCRPQRAVVERNQPMKVLPPLYMPQTGDSRAGWVAQPIKGGYDIEGWAKTPEEETTTATEEETTEEDLSPAWAPALKKGVEAPPCRTFVLRNVPYKATYEHLFDMLAELGLGDHGWSVCMPKTGSTHRGYCFVKFAKASADAASTFEQKAPNYAFPFPGPAKKLEVGPADKPWSHCCCREYRQALRQWRARREPATGGTNLG